MATSSTTDSDVTETISFQNKPAACFKWRLWAIIMTINDFEKNN